MVFQSRKKFCYFKENGIVDVNYKDVKLLRRFVNDQGKAMTLDECNYGKAFEENDRIYFKMEFLLGYLEKQRFRGFDATRVAARLKEKDAESVVRKVEKKNTRLWEIDNESFKRIESLPLPKEEDLNKEENLPF